MENKILNTEEAANSDLGAVSGSLSEFDLLDEEEGSGNYCCGKRMVGKGIMYVCLNCGAEENSSS